jgi:hypothetical protein
MAPKYHEQFYKKCLHPTIMICNSTKSSGGSGFIVKSEKRGFLWQNIVLGAAHTILDSQDLIVKVPKYRNVDVFKGYQEYELAIHAMNTEADMFIGVFVSADEMPTVDLDLDSELKMRTKVFHVGYGLFDDVRFDAGEITQPCTIDPFPFRGMIRTNAFTFSGDSGGPLFSENNYKVIGLCHGIRRKNDIPLPQISYYKSMKEFVSWDNNINNSLNWVYKTKESIPILPFLKLNIKRYEFIPPR